MKKKQKPIRQSWDELRKLKIKLEVKALSDSAKERK